MGGYLVESLLQLLANHHSHHHVQLGVQHQTHAGVLLGGRLQLQPECEIHRNAVVTLDFDIFGRFLVHYVETYVEALDLERAAVLR